MPADPPSSTQPTAPVPHGQAQPAVPHLPPHQAPLTHFPQQVPPQLHHQAPPRLPQGQGTRVSRPQYGVPMNSGHIPSMSQPPQASQQQPSAQGQHRGNAVPMQPTPYYVGGYTPMGAYPHVPAQYGDMSAGYVPYPHTSFPYGGMPQVGNPQQPGQRNPRNPRTFGQQSQAQGAPRQPQPRIVPPAPRKKVILAIVDPDTNEEVKVSKVDTKSTPKVPATPAAPVSSVKIPPRTSRPLELVSDPADSSFTAHADKESSSESAADIKKPEAAETRRTPEISEDKESPVVSEVPSAPAESSDSSNVTVSKAFTTDANSDVEAVAANLSSVSISEGSVLSQQPEPSASTDTAMVDSLPMAVMEAGGDVTKSDPETRSDDVAGGTAENSAAPLTAKAIDSSAQNPSADSVQEPDTAVGTAKEINQDSGKVDSALTTAPSTLPVHTPTPDAENAASMNSDHKADPTPLVTDADAESPDPQTTPRRERPVFRDGDRRVYAPQMMLAMRNSVDPEKSAEYEAALADNNISKTAVAGGNPRGGDLRGTRTVRTNTNVGPLSADPRGKKSFPAQAGPGLMTPTRGPPGMLGTGGVGSYDAFDLRSARSQAPPPAPKGQQANMRDPRGSRTVRDRFDGPVRGGQGPLDPFVNHEPVEKLKRSENGWKRDKESDDEVTAKVKQIRSLLNKLTLEKFEKIFKQIIDIDISSYEILVGVVKEVFEKALFEPKFSGMYAELCLKLDISTKDMLRKAQIMDANGKPIFFKNILLYNCRAEFTGLSQAADESTASVADQPATSDNGEPEAKSKDSNVSESNGDKTDSVKNEELTSEQLKAKAKLEKQEEDLRASKAKRRMLANVTFIGELFLKDLIREQIIHRHCIQKLLKIGAATKEEDVLEALCRLLSKTGEKLSANKDAVPYIDQYFQPLVTMSRDHTLPARVRFMLQDLIEQRSNNWKVRREEAGAKTIAEIHKDIEKEERAKAEAQAAARDRRGRGGGGMHGRNDRMPPNFPPRVAMTMASRRNTGSSVSRSQAMLDKHASRGSTSASSNFDGMRLGPRTTKPSSTTPGAPGGLRPGGGGSRYSALSTQEPRENAPHGQSGDVRRMPTAKKWPASSRRSAAAPEATKQSQQLMEPDKLKRKVASLVAEYCSIRDLKEFQECVEQEVCAPNYPKFLEEACKYAVGAKTAERDICRSLFMKTIGNLFPAADFITAFTAVIPQLADIEMDNPRASEFMAKYVGAVSSTGKLGPANDPLHGLGFIKTPLAKISDSKRASKFVVHLFSELLSGLRESERSDADAKLTVRKALEAVDVDLPGKMSAWNPVKGVSVLSEMLSSEGLAFALPLVPVELKLKEALEAGATKETVSHAFSSAGLPKEELRTEAFMRMVTRVVFDWLMTSPPPSIKDTFMSLMREPVLQCFQGTIPRNVQMASLLEVQSFINAASDRLPPHAEESFDKPGPIAFNSLYFADIVEEETFVQWKDDTDKSTRIEGKEKLLVQTSQFFQWLSTAPVED